MLKIAFCDDETAEIAQLEELLEEYAAARGQEFVHTSYQSSVELMADIEKGERFDIMLLDILMPGENGMKIPLRYVCEMVCDRVAASQIYLGDKYTDAAAWNYYEHSKDHYLLHPETRALLEKLLKMVRDIGQERTFAYMKYLLGCEKDY